jgi:hypothetical protein
MTTREVEVIYGLMDVISILAATHPDEKLIRAQLEQLTEKVAEIHDW